MSLGPVLLSIVFAVLGTLTGVRTWMHLLRAKDVHVPFRRAAEVNLIGSMGKYLPGSVWSFLLQVQLGRRHGITRSRSLIALLVMTAVAIITGLNLSLLALPQFLDRWGPVSWLLVLSPLGLIFLIPSLLSRIVRLALRLMRREDPGLEMPGREIAYAVGWTIASWLLFGVHTFLLVRELDPDSPILGTYRLSLAATALAISAGFIAFVLPSGVGVREVVFVAALSPIMSTGHALAVALVSRLVFIVADLINVAGAAASAGVSLRSLRGTQTLPDDSDERQPPSQ